MARIQFLINKSQLHYVVDVDIKGFFDNVNHTLLLKQLWNLGIHDRKVLACIAKTLKAEIDKEGIPSKGVPQGGLLSTILSNVVLNDLDHWVAEQWNFPQKVIKQEKVSYTLRSVQISKRDISSVTRTILKFSVEMEKRLKSGITR